MTNESVCVLLAAYNGSGYIKEQFSSLISQSVVSDIFVSVDFSSDDTYVVADEYSKFYSRLNILPYGASFRSAGQNFFRLLLDVDLSPYDFIAFSDQDDIWFDFKLQRAIEQLKEKNADGYSSNVTAFWPNGREKLVKKDYPQTDYDHIFESAGPGCTFVMTRKLALEIKKSLIDNRNEIRKIWLHDWYCYAFARSRGFKWFIDSKSTMAYRQHGGNEVGVNSGWKSFKARVLSILSGDGIVKAVNQAIFLGLQETTPIKLLCSGKRIDLLRLAFLAPKCRRKPIDKVMFFIIFLWFSVWGLPLAKR